MSDIHVYTGDGVQTVLPEGRVVELLHSGQLAPETLYWRHGMPDWQPLSTFRSTVPLPTRAFIPHRRTEALPELAARGRSEEPLPLATDPHKRRASRPPRVHFRRYPEPLTTVLQFFLLVCIGVAGLQLANGIVHYSLISTPLPGLTPPPAQGGGNLFSNYAEALGKTGNTLAWIAVAVNTVLIVPYCMWIYQAALNSRCFSAIFRYSPGWSVGCNFVPALNLYLPCVIMQEIWKVSRNPRSWQKDRSSVLVGIWWTLWLLHIVAMRVPFVLARKAHTHEGIVHVALFQTILAGFEFVFYGVFFAVITVIIKNQKTLVTASRRAREAAARAAAATSPTP